MQPCLDCQEANKERRDGAALDYYYRKKYGMARAEYVAANGKKTKAVVVVFPHREKVVEVGA